jgi:hypothetical protein
VPAEMTVICLLEALTHPTLPSEKCRKFDPILEI